MRKFLYILFILLSSYSFGAITFINGTTATSASSGGNWTITFTYTGTVGNLIHIELAINSQYTIPYCQDNNLNTIFPGSSISDGTETSAVFNAYIQTGATAYNCYGLGTFTTHGTLTEFSNVPSINTLISVTATGTGTNPSYNITTDDNNDIVLCNTIDGSHTFSGLSGTLYESWAVGPTIVTFGVTAGTPSTVTCSSTLNGSNTWAGAPTELRTTSNSTSWNYVQISPSGYPKTAPGTPCRATASCTWSIHPTGSNNLIVITGSDNFDTGGGSLISLASIYDCTSPPCTLANTINHYTIPGACNTSAINSVRSVSVYGAYTLSSNPNATNVTATRNQTNGNNNPFEMVLYELSAPNLSSVDNIASQSDTIGASSHTMVATAPLSGANDAIFQVIAGAQFQVPGTPYYRVDTENAHFAFTSLLNTTNGSAPVWDTHTAPNDPLAGCAMAFEYSPALPPVPVASAPWIFTF